MVGASSKSGPGESPAGPEATAPDAEAEAEAEAVERGRWLFAQEARFVAGAATVAQIPCGELPEVCFAGRSNVGKSSLINVLTGRKTLAKVSHTPGRTRQINFFDLGGRLMLADLPGYGYARASKEQVANWTRMVDLYLLGRPPLRRVLLLIDARHGPKDVDRRVMAMLDRAAVSYQAVLTKIDQLRADEVGDRLLAMNAELSRHPAAHPETVATSAEKGAGISELRAGLAALATWPQRS